MNRDGKVFILIRERQNAIFHGLHFNVSRLEKIHYKLLLISEVTPREVESLDAIKRTLIAS